MSPFDLPGPQFLVFYLVYGIAVLAVLAALKSRAAPDQATKMNLSDPYLIACLRGGKNEVLRIATVSLIDRGLVTVSGSQLSAVDAKAAGRVRLPLEQQILAYFLTPKDAASAFKERRFGPVIEGYEQERVRLGLLPNDAVKSTQYFRLGLVFVALWTVAFFKIVLALSRGRPNIGGLLVEAILFGGGAYKIGNPRLTAQGKALLGDLQMLFSSLRERASSLLPGSAPNELALTAAVFGLAAVPSSAFPYSKKLYPKAASSGGSCGSSCGSSDGSSGSSSCGSSCGGGGCGGGCGGCGS